MSFPKGQSSVEFLSIVGIALLISAPIILEAQERMIGIELTDEDAGLQDSIVDISQAIREVSSQDRYSKRTEQFRLGDDISSIEVLEDRVLKVSQNRSGELTYYTRQFDTDIEIQRIPKKEGLHELEVEFLGSKVVVEGDAERQSILQQVFSAVDSADWNQGIFSGTSADRNDNSGNLGIGYLNGTRSDQPNDVGLNNESLVGYWRLDSDVSGIGGTVKDYSGYGNNGKTQNGISSGSEGVFSTNSFQSEEGGDIEFVSVSDDASLDITEEVTMSAWVNLESDASDYWRIVQKGQNTAYEIYMQSGDTYPVLRINNAIDLRAPSIQTSDWTLVTATYDASTDNASIYLDGSLEATTIQDVGNIGTNNNPLRIGTRKQKDTSIDGKIDEVRIYDRALSPNDIRDLYFNGRNGEFNGSYRSEIFTRSQGTDWSALEVNASVPSETDLTATFETLEQGPLQTAQSYASPSEWNLGSFNTTTADNVVVEKQNVSMLEASKPSEFNEGNFNQTTSFSSKPPLDKFETSSQTDFNGGTFEYTSADRGDNSGDLGIGYLNGTKSGQPENNGLNNKSMVGYWRLDKEVSDGETAVDYSGEDNDGSLNTGGNTASGSSGILSTKAFNFDGNDDYLSVPDSSSLDQGSALTVSFWMKADSYPNRWNAFIGKEDWNSGTGWVIYDDGGELYFEQGGGTGIKGSWSRNTGEWYHIVATSVDGGAAKIYVDGDQISSGSVPLSVNDAELNIGSRHQNSGTGSKDNIDGTMDEVRIYNRSLSQSEIEDLYFNGRNSEFTGSYTAKDIDKNQETSWNKLEVNASIPSETSVNATFRALDTDGNLVDSQLIDLSEGLSNYSLSVSNSEDAEVFINGTSSNVTKSWEVHGLEVFSREIADKNEGLRIGYQNGSAGDNLVGYWRMDQNVSGDGGAVRDYSGNESDGTTKGGVSVSKGIMNSNSFEFDGSDDFVINSRDSGVYDFEAPASYSFWAKTTDSSGNYFGILGSHESSNPYHGWAIANDNGHISLWTDQSSWQNTNVNIADGKWHHYVAVIDGSTFSLYKDGVLESNLGYNPPSNENVAFYIADRNDAEGSPFKGKLDEVRVYNKSLTSQEVKNLYFKGRPFQGSYTAEKIDNSQETNWDSLEVNASVPSNTSVNATFRALDTDGGLVAEQDVDLGEGLNNYSLSVASSEDAEVFIDGTSSNVTKTWELHSLEVYSNDVVDRNDGLRIGYRNGSADDSLVGYWRMDKDVAGDGGTVVDYSGEGNDGKTTGGVTTGATGVMSTDAFTLDKNDEVEVNLNYTAEYNKEINITEKSGRTLTDYAAKLKLNTKTLIRQDKLQSDCKNMKFTTSGQKLDYWIEDGCNQDPSTIWVEIPTIPAGSTKTINWTYGDLVSPTTGNGSEVFMRFDNFNDGDKSDWTIVNEQGTVVSWSEHDGVLEVDCEGNWCYESAWSGDNLPTDNVSLGTRSLVTGENSDSEHGQTISKTGDFGNYGAQETKLIRNDNQDVWTSAGDRPGYSNDLSRFYRSEIKDVEGSDAEAWVNEEFQASTDNNVHGLGTPALAQYKGHAKYDWVYYKSYTSPEPAVSVGNEEIIRSSADNSFVQKVKDELTISAWVKSNGYDKVGTKNSPAMSCKEVYDLRNSPPNDTYYIAPDGKESAKFEVYCEFGSNDVWTLITNINDTSANNIPDTVSDVRSGWTETSEGNLEAFGNSTYSRSYYIGNENLERFSPAAIRICAVNTLSDKRCEADIEKTDFTYDGSGGGTGISASSNNFVKMAATLSGTVAHGDNLGGSNGEFLKRQLDDPYFYGDQYGSSPGIRQWSGDEANWHVWGYGITQTNDRTDHTEIYNAGNQDSGSLRDYTEGWEVWIKQSYNSQTESTVLKKTDSFAMVYDNSRFAGKVNQNRTNFTRVSKGWNHLVMVYDKEIGEIELYVNGKLNNTKPFSDSISSVSKNLFLGTNLENTIDEVRIYNRSLSEPEVENLYFSGRPFQGNYTAEKIDNSQETSWEEVEINASVPSDTNLTAEFEALDSDDSVVHRELIDVTGGSSPVNYSLNVQASESARLSFNGTSSNVTKTWKVYDYEVFSAERQVDQSESFIVQDGLNEFSLGVNNSRDARIRLNGTSSDVTQSWSVSNMSVFTE